MSFIPVPPTHFEYLPKSGPLPIANTTRFPSNIATFLSSEIKVNTKLTGPFHKDLTQQSDDIFVAILSLLLLLAIHSILTTILLRLAPGNLLSNHTFSLAHFLHLVTDFRFRYLFRGRGSAAAKLPLDSTVTALAISLLLITFATEALILYYTSPQLIPVTNEIASISLAQPVAPHWLALNTVSADATAPCSVIFLSGVEQRATTISPCLSATIPQFEPAVFTRLFDENEKPLQITITSDLHEYGMDHNISIHGTLSAKYSAMAYYKMNDGKERIVPARLMKGNTLPSMRYVHNMFIAFLLSTYRRDTNDSRITAQLLNQLNIKTENTPGPDVSVIKVNNAEKFFRVVSDRYVTVIKGVPPIAAAPSLSFGRTFLKSVIAIRVAGPDVKDLMMGPGSRSENVGILWFESSRGLNWLTLLIALATAFFGLLLIRLWVHSVSTADIAGLFVGDKVRADSGRSPIEMDDEEMRTFYAGMGSSNGEEHYNFGSERREAPWVTDAQLYEDLAVLQSMERNKTGTSPR